MITFLILINIVLTTFGQILLKFSVIKNNKYYLFVGYFLFLLVIIASYYLMKLIELKYFTVIMSLNYLTVFILSILLFKESINKSKILGIILVVFGIVIFSLNLKG